jgi:hypothetical protein
MTRREYTAGRATTLAEAFAIGAATFTIADDGSDATWPTSADYDFFVTIDAGTAQEERVLCSARSGRVITVKPSDGRGRDNTGEKNHAAGATVWPSWSAEDADEANAHINGSLAGHTSTTSAELRTLISDETGSGSLVFGTSPTIASPTLTGTGTVSGTLVGSPAPGTLAHRNIIVSTTEPTSGLADGDVWIQI